METEKGSLTFHCVP